MRVIAGPEKKARLLSEKERKITAYHEMGHAIVAHYLENTDPVHKISVISRGQSLGYTISLPTEDKFLTTRAELVRVSWPVADESGSRSGRVTPTPAPPVALPALLGFRPFATFCAEFSLPPPGGVPWVDCCAAASSGVPAMFASIETAVICAPCAAADVSTLFCAAMPKPGSMPDVKQETPLRRHASSSGSRIW